MTRRIVYKGAVFTIAFARERSGACPAGEFFDGLDAADQSKLMALFQILGDHGKAYNREKFGDLSDGLYEFKSFQIRMPFAYAQKERGVIVITHGFVKKKQRTPKSEIERAWRIFEEDQAAGKLAIVKRAGR
jgi:phage-related protein